jgi:hypothetical protein
MLLATFAARAEMHKCVSESGTISFSDEPCRTPAASPKKAGDSFTANVLIVKSQSDIENWVKAEPARRRGDFGRLRTVARGEKIHVPLIATFTQSQEFQRVALVGDLEVFGPGEKVQRLPGCCIANRADPRAPTTIVLLPIVAITFDETDPKGEYRVRAKISNGRETVTVEEKFRLP